MAARYMETHDLGRFYWHAMRVPWRTPPAQLGQTHEVEEPWRVGRCLVLRLFVLPYVLVLGWWGPPRDELEMLADELAGEDDLAHEAEAVDVDLIAQFREQEPRTLNISPFKVRRSS